MRLRIALLLRAPEIGEIQLFNLARGSSADALIAASAWSEGVRERRSHEWMTPQCWLVSRLRCRMHSSRARTRRECRTQRPPPYLCACLQEGRQRVAVHGRDDSKLDVRCRIHIRADAVGDESSHQVGVVDRAEAGRTPTRICSASDHGALRAANCARRDDRRGQRPYQPVHQRRCRRPGRDGLRRPGGCVGAAAVGLHHGAPSGGRLSRCGDVRASAGDLDARHGVRAADQPHPSLLRRACARAASADVARKSRTDSKVQHRGRRNETTTALWGATGPTDVRYSAPGEY
jgi:hypothetical protein